MFYTLCGVVQRQTWQKQNWENKTASKCLHTVMTPGRRSAKCGLKEEHLVSF